MLYPPAQGLAAIEPETQAAPTAFPASHPLYTVGYSSFPSPYALAQVIESLDALLVDVRISPRSRNPQWNQSTLRDIFGDTYVHLGQWGNVNYKGGPVQIKDFEGGLHVLRTSHQPLALMCVCRDYAQCHRKTLVGLLAQRYAFRVQDIFPEASL